MALFAFFTLFMEVSHILSISLVVLIHPQKVLLQNPNFEDGFFHVSMGKTIKELRISFGQKKLMHTKLPEQSW